MLTNNCVDIFTSLGVLCILDRMPEAKRLLAGEQMDPHMPSDHYNRGMDLLKAASRSSSLAVRYISIIHHLKGSEVIDSDERVDSVTSMAAPAPKSALGDEAGFILPPDPQTGFQTWTFDPMDSLFPADFDFTEVEALLSGANPLEMPFVAPMVGHSGETYMGW